MLHLDENILVDFVAGQLAGAEAAHVEGHLAECAACRLLVSELATVDATVPDSALAATVERAGDELFRGAIVDRYAIVGRVGAGGMGIVYRARDVETDLPVALKVMRGTRDADARRFAREASVLRSLEDPAIVRYVGHGKTASGEPYIAMEWLEGETLARRLTHGAIAIASSIALVARLAAAVGVAHRRKVVHRDIKPSNVLLPAGDLEQAKILDFGVARLERATVYTSPGALIGTPQYMSPEQARGSRTIDARTDVYALGCVLFECLTGGALFVGDDLVSVLAKVLLEEPPVLRDLLPDAPIAVEALLRRVLSKDPALRPADGDALAAELRALDRHSTLDAHRAPSPALSTEEQTIASVVVAPSMRDASTPRSPRPVRIASAVSEFGGRVERLVDGTMVVALRETGTSVERARIAARCALALRDVMPNAPMALATGRGPGAEKTSAGDVIERAVHRLRGAGAISDTTGKHDGIAIDDFTAGLLDERFIVRGRLGAMELVGERDPIEAERTLLGRPTPCVGRERELTLLTTAFESCVAERRACALLVVAPPGLGKSRLRREFLERLRRRAEPVQIFLGRGDPTRAGSPFGMIAPALRRAAGVLDGEPIEEQRRKLRERLTSGSADPELARIVDFVGELVGVPFPDELRPRLRAARRDPMSMGDQMRLAWLDFLARECAARPVILVLDDLHWGDIPSVAYVDAALRQLKELPLMVLALARTEVREVFPKLWDGKLDRDVTLTPLTDSASERLVRETLGRDVDRDVCSRIVRLAAGNAFFLEELIRAVAEGKGDALPESVLATAHVRLEALAPEQRRTLRAASVFGGTFWRDAVRVLLGGRPSELELRARLDGLAEQELVSRRWEAKFPNQEEYVFRHAFVREAAYASLTDDDRALGHQLAGEWLERAGERDAIALAEHFDRGGQPARAVDWYSRASQQALEGNDFAGAIARAERGIRCIERAYKPDSARQRVGAFRALQAECYRWQGEWPESDSCAAEALSLLRRGSARWCETASLRATSLAMLGRFDELEATGVALVEADVESTARSEHAIALGITAMLLLASQRNADRVARKMEEVGTPLAPFDPRVAGVVAKLRARIRLLEGDLAAELRFTRAALASFEEAGDVRAACVQRVGVGDSYREVGENALAEQTLRAALETAERFGLQHAAAGARYILGQVLVSRNEHAAARELLVPAIEQFALGSNRRLEGCSRIYLASALSLAGEYAAAEEQLRHALRLLELIPGYRAYALGVLADVRLREGRAKEALDLAGAAHAIVLSGERFEQVQIEPAVGLAFAQALAATGDHAGAHRAIAEARARVDAHAARIGDPALRTSFLTGIPENARILELASDWLGEPATVRRR